MNLKALIELGDFIDRWSREHNLKPGEEIQLLNYTVALCRRALIEVQNASGTENEEA